MRLAGQLRPAVITLDVLMPHMDGWAVLTALKAEPVLADIPVIMLTIIDDKNFGYMLGAAEYMTKPIDRQPPGRHAAEIPTCQPACTVLVVEDESATRRMLRRMLKKQGWAVTEAENGRVALERVAEQRPALIVLDLMMPTMDGFAFIAELRQREDWRTIPIVVMTAKDLTPEERQRLNGSVEKILLKGAYSREDLLGEVRRLVASCAPGRVWRGKIIAACRTMSHHAGDVLSERGTMPKILMIEDNEQNRDALSRRLQRHGYDVIMAVDGQQGVAMAQSELPDLILMDLNLPDIDGWEATRILKEAPETQAIPIMAMTAHAIAGDQERALQAGCDDYHAKPVEFQRLLTQIEALLTKTPLG